jgi:phenylpropionate dioxygenase-like ring-hydroxylating dioxygenase large terminal subunit
VHGMTVGDSRRPYDDFVVDSAPDDFRVRTRVYCEGAVFDDEMLRIFEKTWVYVAHESELPDPGDYKVSAVGRLPVIVSRDRARKIHVLLNACRHRGSVVCRKESGNAAEFVCPYHAWVYGSDGKLLSTSSAGGGFGSGFIERVGGLVALPRVATFRGMIFASVSPTGDSLEEHLGPVRRYVDLWFDQSPSGRVRLLEPRRSYYQGNWKFQLENTTDGWHARHVHESAFRTMKDFSLRDPVKNWEGCTRGFARGHGILERPMRTSFPEALQSAYLSLLRERHGAERAKLAHLGRHITIFPNLHLMEYKVRVVQPIAVDKTVVYEFPIEFEDAPPDLNAAVTHRVMNEGSLAAGFVNSDDVEIFSRVQSGMHGARLLEWVILSRGMKEEKLEDTGERVGAESYELPQRALYREWARLMNGPA